jgi:dipeptidyl aminopeptidase/acylaminoacyl peptidase
MTNWIVGHTDRFKAAITERSLSNLFSFYGTSDMGFEDYREFGGHAFDRPEAYAKMSPSPT